jgi:uncharacterized membrane protein YbhN (UPF0104 family)
MSRLWAWGRVIGPAVTLAVLVWRLGTGPFVNGIRMVSAGPLAAAAVIALLTTVSCAWRWRLVAHGLGVELSLPTAVAAYYRSQFLNVTLPGGIVGDVHRGVSHGRGVRDVSRALRAVAWERMAGQVVQVTLTLIILLILSSPVRSSMPVAAAVIVPVVIVSVLVARTRAPKLSGRSWLAIAIASALVVAGHALTFLIAARTAGTTAPLSHLVPIALLAMAAMVLPSVGGWGPREGVAAWAFGAAGLGAQRGITTAVVYGVMVLVACLPGAVVLIVAWCRGSESPDPGARGSESPERSASRFREGAVHA